MKLYDFNGNAFYVETESATPDYPLIHTFAPFETDYSTNTDTPKVLDISDSEFLATFYDKYLGYNTNGVFVGKTELGKDTSNTYNIYQYEFRPKDYDRTILLSSGMHTYEMPAYFGLARWIKEYMESANDAFVWLRTHVRVICIPVINPWGFNQNPKKYGNVNGVNPNRNYDGLNNDWAQYPVYTNEWNQKGSAPFSEAETQILRDFALKYADVARLYIDCHTGLGNGRGSFGDVWCYYISNNPSATKIRTAINALKAHISKTYSVTAKEHTTMPDTDPAMNEKFWTDVAGVPMMVIEQAQGRDTVYQTVPNNSSVAICEYATQIHAYIMAQIQ